MSDPSGMTKLVLAVSRRGGSAPSYEMLIAVQEWSIWGPAWGPEGRARCLIKGVAQRGDCFLSVLPAALLEGGQPSGCQEGSGAEI